MQRMSDINAYARRVERGSWPAATRTSDNALRGQRRAIINLRAELQAAIIQSMGVKHGGLRERREQHAQVEINRCTQFIEEAEHMAEKARLMS
eukprot:9091226-Pyramimonas_sp.AAC.1